MDFSFGSKIAENYFKIYMMVNFRSIRTKSIDMRPISIPPPSIKYNEQSALEICCYITLAIITGIEG
ncbi:unnamed protein product [Dracunculus medinensis]|uniref:Uncharacterized protein n=1 Tax=Dracunculus medinensis TaxID=318479 RepID=A0A0N4UL86_DRAME|nr:unnamed protein product [Dracunculus medinensis]